MDLVVIDGPNLFNTIASKLDADDEVLTFYLEECFDVDLLVVASLKALAGRSARPRMGIVIFHSRKPLGRGAYYLADRKTETFWARQASNPDTSAFTVDIPGDQQDTFAFQCSKCGYANEVATRAEKGIDTSITTYLMETLESWESVCLFSRDADYAPLVAALRRKGKMVYVAVPAEERATALVRVSQSTVALDMDFVRRDIAVSKYLMPDGILDELVASLTAEKDLNFTVDEHSEESLALGIVHPKGADAGIQAVISSSLARAEAIGLRLRVQQRNDRFLIIALTRDEAVQRKIVRFLPTAGWGSHVGNMFDLLRRVVDGGR